VTVSPADTLRGLGPQPEENVMHRFVPQAIRGWRRAAVPARAERDRRVRRQMSDPLVRTLARQALFADTPRRLLQGVVDLSTPVILTPGRTLWGEGDYGREAAIIVSGTAAVFRRERLLARLGEGDLLGEIALLRTTARTASVITESPLVALVFDPREFSQLLQIHESIERRVVETVDHRLRANGTKHNTAFVGTLPRSFGRTATNTEPEPSPAAPIAG